MSKTVLTDRIFAFGGRRLSKDSNKIQFDPRRAEVPDDDFENKVDKILPGAYNADIMVSGGTSEELEQRLLPMLAEGKTIIAGSVFQADSPFAPFTLCMDSGGAVGSRAAFCRACITSFKWTGDFGARKDFDAKFYPDNRITWGVVMFQSVGTNGIGGATVGAGLNLGALGAGQELVIAYQILDPPGVTGTNPTLDGAIQSGTSNAFTVPTTRLTLPQATQPAGFWLSIDGDVSPTTDTWWRPNFSAVGGTATPKFYVLMAAAIRTK